MTEIEIMQKPRSHFGRNIFILIIIAMLFWQFAIPFIDDSIKIPSEYFNEITNPVLPNDLIMKPIIIDRITNVITYMPKQLSLPFYETNNYQMVSPKSYFVGVECDLPGKLTGYYSWNYIIYVNNETSGVVDIFPFSQRISGYECFYKNQWTISENIVFINYEITYGFKMSINDDDGTPIKVLSYIPGLTIYESEFFMLKVA